MVQVTTRDKLPFPVPNPTTSYWLATPHRLASYRSSSTVPETCDIAIIGTGMAGVCTAYHILTLTSSSSPKPNIVLLDARQVCSGATGRNGGHTKLSSTAIKEIVEKHGWERAAEIARSQLVQLRELKKVVEKEGLECEFLLRRSWDCFWDEEQAGDVKRFLEEAGERGEKWMEHVQWVEGAAAEKITGTVGLKGATSCPAASLWPYKFTTGLLERAMDMGAKLYTETMVESVSERDSCSVLHTTRGTMKAKKVVFATNAYTSALLPQYKDVITPYRGANSHLVADPEPPFLESTYNLRYGSHYDYMSPQPDGGVILGGATPVFRGGNGRPDKAPWWNYWDDSETIDGVKEYFENTMTTRMSEWKGRAATVDRTWTGIMASTPNSFPRVGLVEGKHSQWMLCGFNGGGMTMIMTISQAIAKMVVNGTAISDTRLPLLYQNVATH